ncbi:amino acid ABC transporter [Klebsiella pneumoniae subsp. rhinoscleromatis]|nr:amino acid ABC transporter [Klebsiella pneumoniae subsp. rhinoscleromatis]
MTTFTDWDIIRNLLLAGRWTVLLSLVAFTGGALVTLPLLLLRLTGGRQVKRLIRGYIELFQGTPLLMQLFLAFFGVALFGVDVSAWTAASVALTLYTSAFSAGYLVRQHSRAAERPVGSLALSRAELRPDPVPGGGAASAAPLLSRRPSGSPYR